MQIYHCVNSEHAMLTCCAGFLKWHNPQSARMPTKRQRSRTGCPMARGHSVFVEVRINARLRSKRGHGGKAPNNEPLQISAIKINDN